MDPERSVFNPKMPAVRGGNSERLARCRRVVDSLVTAGIAVAATGFAASVLIA